MARENLPTNYVNYELATAMGGMRRFNQINNSDGTISFEDATTYSVTGTTYGASEINTANALINEINELVGTTSISGSGQTDITSLLGGTDITNATLGIGDGTVTGAISKLNSNLTGLTLHSKIFDISGTVSGAADVKWTASTIIAASGLTDVTVVAIICYGTRPATSWSEIIPYNYYDSSYSAWGFKNNGSGGSYVSSFNILYYS